MSTTIENPTAPLPSSALHAMRALELRLTAVDYRRAEARANDLIAIGAAGAMSDLDADDLAHAVDLMAGYRATLAAAGRLDLIGVAA